MNEAIYLEVLPFKVHLQVYCVERSNVPSDKLRAIGEIWQKIYGKKDIDYSCRGCVDSFMYDVYNLMRAYENSTGK